MRSGTSGGNKRRLYKPSVEALDALRLLSTAVQGLPDLAIEQNLLSDAGTIAEAAPGSLDATWDVALLETRLADLRKPAGTAADPEAIASGLSQLNRYLSRAWYRRGSPRAGTRTVRRRSIWPSSRTWSATSSTPWSATSATSASATS